MSNGSSKFIRRSKIPVRKRSAKITREEQQNFEQASTRIREIQQSIQSKMAEAVENAGLNVQRFNQIFAAVRGVPSLQQKVQQMI